MAIRSLLLATVAAAAVSTAALAQTAPPVFPTGEASFEGPISDLDLVPADGTGPTITIFNTKIKLAAGAKYSSPSKEGLSFDQVVACNDKQIPGRLGIGWKGGTGILSGNTTGVPNTTATDVFLEPAENVLIGKISELPGVEGGTKFRIEGTEIILMPKEAAGSKSFPVDALSQDEASPCIPGLGIKNEFGFELPTSALALGSDAVAEGWFSNNGSKIFYAFLIDGVGTPQENPRSVSITRAQCRQRQTATNPARYTNDWEIRGGVVGPNGQNNQTVWIRLPTVSDPSRLPSVRAVPDADTTGSPFGSFTWKASRTNESAGCPAKITVTYGQTVTELTPSAEATVEVRF
jgi:hypothetical protein